MLEKNRQKMTFLILGIFVFSVLGMGVEGVQNVPIIKSTGMRNDGGRVENNSVINGTVFDEGGSPLPAVTVFLLDDVWDMVNHTFTDASGNFIFTVQSNSYWLVTDYENYDVFFDYLFVDENETITRNIMLKYMGNMTAELRGTVTDEQTGEPLADVEVELGHSEFNWDNSTYTDAQGNYSMALYPGDYDVNVFADGYVEIIDEELNGIKEAMTHYLNLTLKSMGDKNAHISGTITSALTDLPIAGCSVELYNEDMDWWDQTDTDAWGEYELDVYPGSYSITVNADGYFSEDDYFTLDENETDVFDFELELTPAKTSLVKGYVQDEWGELIQDYVLVGVMDFFNESEMWDYTLDGYYEIEVYEANYLVIALAEDYCQDGKNVRVSAGSEVWVNFTLLENNALVTGYVVDSEGSPLKGMAVNLENEYVFGLNDIYTDDEGYYEIPAPAGTYVLMVNEDDQLFESVFYTPYVDEINVAEEQIHWCNITLWESKAVIKTQSIDLVQWDHAHFEMKTELHMNETIQSRVIVDMMVGNGDLNLNESELEYFIEKIIEGEIPDEDDEEKMWLDETSSDFLIDGVHYLLDEDSKVLKFEGMSGAWDTNSTATLMAEGDYNSASPIDNIFSHKLDINISWKPHDEKSILNIKVLFPEMYGVTSCESPENITLEGSNPWHIIPGYNPHHEEMEGDEPVAGEDYIFIHAYVNNTINVSDNTDNVVNCGEDLNFELVVADPANVVNVKLEYKFLHDNNSTVLQLNGTNGTYSHILPIPLDKMDKIEYQFIIILQDNSTKLVPGDFKKIVEIKDTTSPQSVLVISSLMVNIGIDVHMNGSASSDNIGISSYNFSFGDGNWKNSENAEVVHNYKEPGNYTVGLEVKDQDGNVASTSLVIVVINDTDLPEVVSSMPINGALDVDPNTPVWVVFSEDIVLDQLTLKTGNLSFNHTWDPLNFTLNIQYDGNLTYGANYSFVITVSDGVGNQLKGYLLNFTVITFGGFDSDGDGVPNELDDFPDNPTGATDTDGDGMPDDVLVAVGWLGINLTPDPDDDNDGWEDVDEVRLETDPRDATSFPLDLDQDGLADEEDEDIDGDGVLNGDDEDPYDALVGEKASENDVFQFIIFFSIIGLLGLIIVIFMVVRNTHHDKEEVGEGEMDDQTSGALEDYDNIDDLDEFGWDKIDMDVSDAGVQDDLDDWSDDDWGGEGSDDGWGGEGSDDGRGEEGSDDGWGEEGSDDGRGEEGSDDDWGEEEIDDDWD